MRSFNGYENNLGDGLAAFEGDPEAQWNID